MSHYNNRIEDGCLFIIALPFIGFWYLLKWLGKIMLYVIGSIIYVPYMLFLEPIVDVIKGEKKPSKGCLITIGIIIALFLWVIIAEKLGL